MLKVVNVVGARPNFVKMAPIAAEMGRRRSDIRNLIVHTGQHYDDSMSGAFFRDLDLPQADLNLGVGSASHAQQTARVMLAFEPVIENERPDWVVVVGDVNSTLACALVASKCGVRVAHVEAGLRSFDRTMPEELNRLLTDQLSDLLLTPSPDADENLIREGIDAARIVRVGNVMIDSLFGALAKADASPVIEDLGLEPRQYAVATLHRPANVDDAETLRGFLKAFEAIAERTLIIFPAHPRTVTSIVRHGLVVSPRVRIIEPLGYIDFLRLWSQSALVLTDSGGMQEETTVLGIPCLTLRENTERPITVTEGTNQIVGRDPRRIVEVALKELARGSQRDHRVPEMWDGHASERIVNALLTH